MTSKERVIAALEHRQVDAVPMDFGSTSVTGMHVLCVAALRKHYGLPSEPIKVIEPYQMLGEVDEDLKRAMGVDTDGITPLTTIFGFANENWKPWDAPFGLKVLVPENFITTVDAANRTYIYPQGDKSVPPSGVLPEGGYFFDTIVRQEPIDESRLDPRDNIEEFRPLSDADLTHLRSQARNVASSDRAVVATFGGLAFGDIALVPAPFLKHPKGIRDITEWYIATAGRRDYVHRVFSEQCEIALANLPRIYEAVGNTVNVVFICGTDFGTQTSSFCSVETYRELYHPYYKQINDWIHQHTPWKTFKHSCGAVEKFIEPFIESGFDILNPVQCSATGMDPRQLLDTYGGRIVFWGGGVDTQKTLPFGTPAEVRKQVLERCEVFASGSGFVFNAIHNVQANTPPENIVAMIEAIKEFNGRK
ncbi:MAG: methyltransferase [Phycisphaerales bacterium]|nr:methyltransferase [Phycisphaerales bacterium]